VPPRSQGDRELLPGRWTATRGAVRRERRAARDRERRGSDDKRLRLETARKRNTTRSQSWWFCRWAFRSTASSPSGRVPGGRCLLPSRERGTLPTLGRLLLRTMCDRLGQPESRPLSTASTRLCPHISPPSLRHSTRLAADFLGDFSGEAGPQIWLARARSGASAVGLRNRRSQVRILTGALKFRLDAGLSVVLTFGRQIEGQVLADADS
jgi:hypothetical protein